jgi:hypothetical protein
MMSKEVKVVLGIFLLSLLIVTFSTGDEWTWQCNSWCERNCSCYGDHGWAASGPCCGGCVHEFWYGLDYVDCCICGSLMV